MCITDSYKDFTKGKEYEIFNIDSNYISVLNDYSVSINFLSLHNTFKLKEEKETAYKETEGKLFYELDFEFITQMAERMASNKGKYEPYNWQKLDNIEDITATTSGAFAAIFDYGTVKIQTAAEVTEFEFANVPHPAKVTTLLNELLQEEEREKIEGRVN